MSSIPEVAFEIGQVYDRRKDINGPFGGAWQSGISPSTKTAAIFIFSGESGEQYGYKDGFDDHGVFHYTGHGQVGDMQLTGGNRAIFEHARDGRSIHLFKSLGKKAGKSLGQRYLGEFACADLTWTTGPDREKNTRKIIVFHLVPIGRVAEALVEESAKADLPSTLAAARQLALKAMEPGEARGENSALRNIYKRSAQVKNYVLLRAEGKCEACGKPAPFLRKDGTPYLEPHHINRLSDGGLDHPLYVGAICPDCHREIHYGVDGQEKNEALRAFVQKREAEIRQEFKSAD